jgi:ABC-type nitrate/sulfonate/bicarbonate transport system permease component
MSALIGIAFYLIVLLVEHRLMPWHSSMRETA